MSNMATVSTCDRCGLSYRDSLIPHQCAEWTKGRKEAKETQPMSDTLQEREDQVDQHQSGTCTIPECPCREWSSQIAAAEDSRQRREAIKLSQAVARAESANPVTSEHEPAARGEGDGPERIWIAADTPFDLLDTWDKKINDSDIEYVRMDQHHSLVAERERLRQVIRDEIDAIHVWKNAIHPRSDVQEGLAISLSKLEAALDEQRSTPQ